MRRLFPDAAFVPVKLPDPNKDLVRLVIAEAPGAEESLKGEPLVGGAGRWFDSMIQKAGINRDGLTLANCLSCRPPNNVFPSDPAGRGFISKSEADEAIQHCLRSHLAPVLASRDWKRVDLLGDKPLRLVANRKDGIFHARGSPLRLPGCSHANAIATLHPAYVMRDQTMFPVVVNDLMKGLDIAPEDYKPFPTIEDVKAFTSETFAFDIECPKYRLFGEGAPVEMVGLCASSTRAICVPVRGPYIPELKRIFLAAKTAIGHNCIQFDLPKLRDAGIKISPECTVYDTMLLQHLLFPDFPHDLEFVGSQFVAKPAWKDDKEVLETYCCRDTDVTFQCWQALLPMVKKQNLLMLYERVQVPLAQICLLMHETGVKTDPNQIKFVREKLLAQSADEELLLPEFLRSGTRSVNRRVKAEPGTLGKSGKPVKFTLVPATESVVPWRSPAAKARYLYSKEDGCLGVDAILDVKSGNITTGKVALEKIYAKTKNRAVRAIRILNQIDETLSTFAKEGMVKIKRMYPHFNVHGTASGRLSSSDPNLQNIPEPARVIYVPSYAGWKIVDVDYSQIENRLTGYFAGDTERLERFKRDPQFSEHKYAASLFLGIPYDDVVKDNDKDAPYGKAKKIVHGTNYGMGAKKISNLYDMELKDVKALQDTWKRAIQPTILWQMKCGQEAKDKGVLVTPFGRKRWFWTSSYYTESLSFLPQSTAADVVFRAMIGLMYDRIGLPLYKAQRVAPISVPLPEPARLLLQVHDSLVFECPSELVETLVAVVTKVMTQPWAELGGMSIPIGVKVGDNWLGEA